MPPPRRPWPPPSRRSAHAGSGCGGGATAPTLERARPSVPTGHPALDAALAGGRGGTGGWPRGALALLDAPQGSGATTLALGSLAAAQAEGGLTAWLDLDGTFDPAVAARLGVGLEWLLVARPHDPAEAIELAAWLGRSGLIDALVLDLGERATPDRRALDRLGSLLARSGSTSALVLAPAGRAVAGAVAGVRVALRRTAWLGSGATSSASGCMPSWSGIAGRWSERRPSSTCGSGRGGASTRWSAALAGPQPLEDAPALRVVSA